MIGCTPKKTQTAMRESIPDPYNPKHRRGVFRQPLSPRGYVTLTIVDSDGELMAQLMCRSHMASHELECRLRRWLESEDPNYTIDNSAGGIRVLP